jgi:hypothetical protein
VDFWATGWRLPPFFLAGRGAFWLIFSWIILKTAVKEDENGADAQKHKGF